MIFPALFWTLQASIDEKAEALLAANAKAIAALQSLQAEAVVTTASGATGAGGPPPRRLWSQVLMGRPQFLRYESWLVDAENKKLAETPASLMLSDGKQAIRQSGKTYMTLSNNPATLTTGNEPWDGFFSEKRTYQAQFSDLKQRGSLTELKLAEPENIDGRTFRVVSYAYTLAAAGRTIAYSGKLYFGDDNLAWRRVQTLQLKTDTSTATTTTTAAILKLTANVPVPAAETFAYTPPVGVTPFKPATPAPRPPLLAVGTPAPDFTVYTLEGKPVKLSDFKGKVVVMDFWATWCGPCMVTMPHIEKTWQKIKDRSDITVLGVCVWDKKEAYEKWVPENKAKFTFPLVLDPAGRAPENVAKALYKVSGIPTTYIIDKDGNIAASFVGSRDIPAGVEPALKKLGIPLE